MKLSVITINYNNVPGLKQTMQSVFAQTFKDFEYIIIDGGSTDGSRALIEENKELLAHWKSERDGGIYNAMNKGINCSEGEYLLFLNSGDLLVDQNSLAHFFINNYNQDIICADIKRTKNGTFWIKIAPDTLSFEFLTYDTLPHQSSLIKRSLFNKVGLYKEDLKFVSDWKFYLDAFIKFNATYKHISQTLCEFNELGITSHPENAGTLLKEREDVLQNEYPLFYKDYKDYQKCKADLRNYTSSRAHTLLARFMNSTTYQFLKKIIRAK